MSCPTSGKELPGEFAFCPYCAAPLNEPRPVLAREERKVVSVLFCDLVGFTAASEQADPEDVRARIRPYHAQLRQEIERFGGTVEKFVGDAVMAVFGAPAAHEDDAERAVRAGLRILEAIEELNAADPGLELQVRVGINTGEAVVSLDARPEEGEGFVVGDVVNTASRLQGAAPLNGIAVSEHTYRQTRRVFDYERLESVRVKGKAEPLAVSRPLATRARLGSDVTRMQATPFVGREVERTLLQGLFDRCARDSTAQLVTLVGEPGMGKSRLVAELFRYIDERPELIRWRQGRCLPYGDGITFWALGEIVKAHAGVYESDSAEVAVGKLEGVLPDAEERPWLRARLLPLLGVDSGQPTSREESFAAWRRFVESIASGGPAVVVVEDLHWADPALLDFLAYLAEWAEGVPLLLLCTARPELFEQNPGWAGGTRNATTINLSPLLDAETDELVQALLTQTVSEHVERTIREQAGGNPLYAEELVRLHSERGLGAANGEKLALPDSLQSLIAARLDTLAPERKRLLQDAAVVGEVFWAGALTEMGERDSREVELALHELSRKELVHPARTSSMEGEAEYAFWHALVRDVAYGQIPRSERARRHRAAAAWIEQKAGDRVEDLAEVLAHHYLQAFELAQAAGASEEAAALVLAARRYLALAGERAIGLDAAQAEARLAQALELHAADGPDRTEVLLRWAQAALEAGHGRDAASALDDALPGLRERGETAAAGRALMLLSWIARNLGEARHLALAAEAVSVLEQLAPSSVLVDACTQLANAQAQAVDWGTAVAAFDRSLALAKRLGLPTPAYALGLRGYARAIRGERDGIVELEAALALLREQGAGREAGGLMNQLAIARSLLEGWAAALASYEEAIAFCSRRGLAGQGAVTEGGLVEALAATGRTEQALERVVRLIAAAEASGNVYVGTQLRALEISIQACRGETEASLAHAEAIVSAARKGRSTDVTITTFAAAATAHLADSVEQARALLVELESTPGARENPNYPFLLPAMVRTALAAGDQALARRLAEGLEPIFPVHDHALYTTRAALAETAGDLVGAADLYEEAADRWRQFVNVPERAYALLGQGRCLVALGGPAAQDPLREAQEPFQSMGYRPALAETEALLAQAMTPAP